MRRTGLWSGVAEGLGAGRRTATGEEVLLEAAREITGSLLQGAMQLVWWNRSSLHLSTTLDPGDYVIEAPGNTAGIVDGMGVTDDTSLGWTQR